MNRQLREWNITQALKLGFIDWFKFFELMKELEDKSSHGNGN